MKKIKKILLINYEYPPLGGGGGVASYELAKEWAKSMHVDVLTSSYKGLPLYEVVDGVHIHRCRIFGRTSRDAANFHSMLLYLVTGFFKGFFLCLKNRYSIINTHFAVPSGPLGHLLSKLFRVKNVLSIHGGDIYDPSKKMSPHKNRFFRAVVHFILNGADSVVAQSTNTRDNAVSYYAPKKKIEIIPLAFTKPIFPVKSRKELGLSDDDFLLVAIGRLVKRKALDDAIAIIEKVRKPTIKFLIIGDGPERLYLEEYAKERGLALQVKFLGYLSYEEKYQYVRCSDMMLMTSLHEGFGIIFMEGMYFGLPIACTNHGGQVDFLTTGKNGILFDVGDITSGAQAVSQLYDDRALFDICSKNNKQDITQFYSDRIAQRYVTLFEEL